MGKRPNSEEITRYLLSHVCLLPPEYLVTSAATAFGISRQAIHKRLKKLEADGLIRAEGRTKGKKYFPVWIGSETEDLPITSALAEDKVWRESFRPRLPDLNRQAEDICYYGFTEILNNARDHSEGETVHIEVKWGHALILIEIHDDGVGIFRKIQRDKGLDDQRHAILELTKGKLTTDPEHHTGEGIFFTSRAFDEFSILSGELFFKHSDFSEDWLLEGKSGGTGTLVSMLLMRETDKDLKRIFDKYTASPEDYSFSSTHVPVDLARYGDELLVSRSQAKRLLARFESFREVMLDFKGVSQIGQAFADEVFRVFRRENPTVKLSIMNVEPDVEQMIRRAMGADFADIGNR